MRSPVVERRSLTRPRSLEDHLQDAIDSLRMDGAVEGCVAILDAMPPQHRVTAARAVLERVSEPAHAPVTAVRLKAPRAREKAEAVFVKGRAA